MVQFLQDITFCHSKYPLVICRPVAIQFLDKDSLAILEINVDQEHLSAEEITNYKNLESCRK